jgi:hypothetical protein
MRESINAERTNVNESKLYLGAAVPANLIPTGSHGSIIEPTVLCGRVGVCSYICTTSKRTHNGKTYCPDKQSNWQC